MGEKVLWDFLLESLPGSVGVDTRLVGKKGEYSKNAREYINHTHPNIQVVIQNASFIRTVDETRYTIAFLQDDLRAMKQKSNIQEQNLWLAKKLVTNSIITALSYPEYDFELISVGVDSNLFVPMDKFEVRKEHGFKDERIGIFVGNFSEVKGWSKVRECIEQFPEIKWILVSKYDESFSAPNVQVYNRISQQTLVKLLNCADFFIIGSPVETQCLAAIEACLCNVPVIMQDVGIFTQFSEEEHSKTGIFGGDFISAIREIQDHTFSPRQVIIDKKLTVNDSMQKWNQLLNNIFQELMIEQIKPSPKASPKKFRKLRFRLERSWRNSILFKLTRIDNLNIYTF
ncbi:MAG: glycosyltransferase, partial [Candidatus Heimdallarchaeota archaeon]|nr:glycosyltransferase [Candidatus Heimdallarchaeota archaeon]